VHIPVLASEALDALAIQAGGTYVDGTFGRGGHSREILARLGPRGRLIALDRDPDAESAARAMSDPRFSFFRTRFSALGELLEGERVNGMLFDLGVSSPQLEDAARGFSFRTDAPLDMRMDPTVGVTAAQWLAAAEEQRIREVIRDYGEERFAKQIAAAIAAARRREPIVRTRQLADLVAKAVGTREPGQDPATRTFQALRIHLNRELEEVSLMLPQATAHLAAGGRLAVISFHSLEDRIVKRFMQSLARPRCAPPLAPARQRNATTRAQADRSCGASVGGRDKKKPAGAKRHPQGGRAHRGRL
jgi:16S rRNA (cytosine1402-N4)-methyltransferase